MKIPALLLAIILFNSAALSQTAVPHVGPLISGTSSYVDGQWAWTDYAYDDRGVGSDTVAGGDSQYPEGLRNSAYLSQVQVGFSAESVELTALLQTLTDISVPEITFLIDNDASKSTTGATSLPGGAWTSSGALGAEWIIVASNTGPKVLRRSGTDWDQHALLPTSVNLESKIVSVSLPRSIVDLGTGKWRLFSLAALASNSILDGGAIYDLVFVVGELITDRNTMVADSVQGAFISGGTTLWQDQRQSAILAGSGDSDAAAAIIDFGRLAARDTELASADGRGWYTFLHRSTLKLAEGVEQGASGNYRKDSMGIECLL